MDNAILMYNIITTSPIDIAIFILSTKFGISKFIIMIIIAFI
jgi:hypothetical protein